MKKIHIMQNRKKIIASLEEDQILFDPDDAKALFEEAGVLFAGQVKRDFQQLIAFNRAITEERHGYLVEERSEIEAELKTINGELNTLGKRHIVLTIDDLRAVVIRADIRARDVPRHTRRRIKPGHHSSARSFARQQRDTRVVDVELETLNCHIRPPRLR